MKKHFAEVLKMTTAIAAVAALDASRAEEKKPEAVPQAIVEKFESRMFSDGQGGTLNYRLLKPKNYDAAKKYPLVLFLHGAGERGDNNLQQLKHGTKLFASDEMMEKYPAFVLAPQCPANQKWSDVDWHALNCPMPEKASPPMALAIGAVDAMQKEFSIDADRVYITGLSMGGYGTWDAICRYPGKFAAAAPCCGGGYETKASLIAKLPIWVFHGEKDPTVPVVRSRNMIAALKEAGGDPKYTEYPGVGHNSWDKAYAETALYDWLFAQKRSAAK
jgi:predicted peptidase